MAQEHTCLATWLADVHPPITVEALEGAFQNIRSVQMDDAGRAYLTFLSAEAMETAVRALETVQINGRRITVTRIALLISDPPAGPKKRRCSRCRRTGHNVRTCPVPADQGRRWPQRRAWEKIARGLRTGIAADLSWEGMVTLAELSV